MTAFELFSLLLAGHFIADYPMQGDFLSRAKNHTNPIAGVPWYQALMAHATIHGAFVGLITGSLFLGVIETILHAMIDYRKCAGRIGYNQDQAWHVSVKAAIALDFYFRSLP